MSGDNGTKIVAILVILAVIAGFYMWYTGGNLSFLSKPSYQPLTPLSPMAAPEAKTAEKSSDGSWLWYLLLFLLLLGALKALKMRRTRTTPPTYAPVYTPTYAPTYAPIYAPIGRGPPPIIRGHHYILRILPLNLGTAIGRHLRLRLGVLFTLLLSLSAVIYKPNHSEKAGVFTSKAGTKPEFLVTLSMDGELIDNNKNVVVLFGNKKITLNDTKLPSLKKKSYAVIGGEVLPAKKITITARIYKIGDTQLKFPVEASTTIIGTKQDPTENYIMSISPTTSTHQEMAQEPTYYTVSNKPQEIICKITSTENGNKKQEKGVQIHVTGAVTWDGSSDEAGLVSFPLTPSEGDNIITLKYGTNPEREETIRVVGEQLVSVEVWISESGEFIYTPLESGKWMQTKKENAYKTPKDIKEWNQLDQLVFKPETKIKVGTLLRNSKNECPETINGQPVKDLKFTVMLEKDRREMKLEQENVFVTEIDLKKGATRIITYTQTKDGTYVSPEAIIVGSTTEIQNISNELEKLKPPRIDETGNFTENPNKLTVHMVSTEFEPFYVGGLGMQLTTTAVDLARNGNRVVVIIPIDEPQTPADWQKIWDAYKPEAKITGLAKTKMWGEIPYTLIFGSYKANLHICLVIAKYREGDVRLGDASTIYAVAAMDLKDVVLSKALDLLYEKKYVALPQVVNVQSYHGLLSLFIASKKYGIPTVYTIHALDHYPFNNAVLNETDDSLRSLVREADNNFSGKLTREWLCAELADIITIPSEAYFKEEFKPYYTEFLDKTQVIFNTASPRISHPYFNREKARKYLADQLKVGSFEGKTLFLLPAGRLDPRKGHEIVTYHLDKALIKNPNLVFVIIVTGIGKEGIFGTMATRIEELRKKYPNNVYFLNRLDSDEMAVAYSASDFTVIPSLSESFGLIAIESLFQGTPIITTDCGGLKDIIKKVGKDKHVFVIKGCAKLRAFFKKNWMNNEKEYLNLVDAASKEFIKTLEDVLERVQKKEVIRIERSETITKDVFKKLYALFGKPSLNFSVAYHAAINAKNIERGQ